MSTDSIDRKIDENFSTTARRFACEITHGSGSRCASSTSKIAVSDRFPFFRIGARVEEERHRKARGHACSFRVSVDVRKVSRGKLQPHYAVVCRHFYANPFSTVSCQPFHRSSHRASARAENHVASASKFITRCAIYARTVSRVFHKLSAFFVTCVQRAETCVNPPRKYRSFRILPLILRSLNRRE